MIVTATVVLLQDPADPVASGPHGAGYVGPESAAVPELLSRGLVERNEDIFVFNRGAGHNYPPPPTPRSWTPTVTTSTACSGRWTPGTDDNPKGGRSPSGGTPTYGVCCSCASPVK